MYFHNNEINEGYYIPTKKERFWFFLKNKRIGTVFGTVIILFLATFVSFLAIKKTYKISKINPEPVKIERRIVKKEEPPKPKYEYVYVPVNFSMEDIKNKGCVADGILSEYGDDTKNAVAMINRSNCKYLHRALETWADQPDFQKATKIMAKIKKPGIVYGMFIAEAIKTGEHSFEKNGKKFDFSDMCQNDSKHLWGENTCKASLNDKNYRKYIKEITEEAMDIGIQSFLFGQIYLQDNTDPKKEKLLSILNDMRDYAHKKGIQIIIGAQTGSIVNEKYLRMFDYIEGGIGMGEDGMIESGPCWSRKESCWALLWNDRYAKKANNVLLHLDWSGLSYDDMSVFARMDKSKRGETLKYLHNYFTSKKMGFLMPMMATLYPDNGGCYGPKKGFYSASNKYKCQDEGIINSILTNKK